MGLFDKFKIGLGKSSDGLSTGFKNIFSKKKIDENVLTEFEELIITSDAGVEVAKELRKDFENFKVDKKLDDHEEILKLIADKLAINLQKYEKDLSLMGNAKSAVIVVSGVNGVGKTTSIGKLGKYFKDNNRSVVFGAADTFRAAAIDQLQVWAAKVKVDIIKSEINSDPASVAFKTAEFAKKNEIDVALIDTAGRLQNKKNLMEEYKKIANELNLINHDTFAFCWIIDYPMFEEDEQTNKIIFSHNPFSMPQGNINNLDLSKPLNIKAYQYDIVCNGIELSSGAIRNHIPELMYKLFSVAGYEKKVVDEKFSGMINALSYGAPPHGGIAPGIDRIIMLLANEKNIREVTMFPMNQNAQDLMMNAPSSVSDEQLKELNLSIKPKK